MDFPDWKEPAGKRQDMITLIYEGYRMIAVFCENQGITREADVLPYEESWELTVRLFPHVIENLHAIVEETGAGLVALSVHHATLFTSTGHILTWRARSYYIHWLYLITLYVRDRTEILHFRMMLCCNCYRKWFYLGEPDRFHSCGFGCVQPPTYMPSNKLPIRISLFDTGTTT